MYYRTVPYIPNGREIAVTVYSDAFKTRLVQKMLVPNPRLVSALAREAGVPEGTLYRWKKEITLGGMSADRSDDKPHVPHEEHHRECEKCLEVFRYPVLCRGNPRLGLNDPAYQSSACDPKY